MRIASQVAIEFTIGVGTAVLPARNVTKHAQTESLVGSFSTGAAELLAAAR